MIDGGGGAGVIRVVIGACEIVTSQGDLECQLA